ncbi:hypothetical protein [uncultured Polaribacter sp.]|uniref:DUF6985 domain-containing protein n=1 Tax=uncultured Polaribacter sp. TaxID=174711 RepID=UPI0026388BE4|nr:hypothetical protein [uncultured Polaribacter sp.]
MNLKSIGKLIKKSSNYSVDTDWISTNNIPIPFFDKKELPIIVDCSCYEGQWSIDEIDSALINFLKIKTNIELKQQIEKKAFENWEEFNDAVGFLDSIETYGLIKDRPEWMEQSLQNCLWLKKLITAKKVWNYIHPTDIIVTKDRYEKKEGVFIQILCKCDWEDEHGLQIILKNGEKLIRVSEQDGHLFD